jgi:hypothetical protein
VAAVVLLCQAAAWVHAAAIPHVTCLEHGESVHLPAHLAATKATASPGNADADAGDGAGAGLAATAATSELDAHTHDHCGLQGQRTTSAAAPDHESSVARFAPASLPAVADARPVLRLLRLAPKTSPPRAPAA